MTDLTPEKLAELRAVAAGTGRRRAVSASETEYTPTTGDVRNVYGNFRWDIDGDLEAEPEFDRWFARVQAEAQIHILREVVDYLESVAHEIGIRPATAYSSEGLAASVAVGECANFIRDEAARIAREAGIEQEDDRG